MSRQEVGLRHATFYHVDEIHIEHCPEADTYAVYLTLLCNESETKFPSELQERKLRAARITCFSLGDERPKVIVDGQEIAPNPPEPEPEEEEQTETEEV